MYRHGDRPYLFTFANLQGETGLFYYDVDPTTRRVQYKKKELNKLRALFSDPTMTFWAHNAQFDRNMIEAALGIKTKCIWKCTMNLIRTVKSDAPLKLKEFCAKHLGISNADEEALRKEVQRRRGRGKVLGWKLGEVLETDYWMAPTECMKYGVFDALRVMAIINTLSPEVVGGLKDVLKYEEQLWPIMREVEDHGVHIDRAKTLELRDRYQKKSVYYSLIFKVHAPTVNPRSHPQLKKLLYETYNEPVIYSTKSKLPATDYYALKGMKNPCAKALLEMRACNKTVDAMEEYLHYMVQHEDGGWYIHPNFNQAIPVTGRESCTGPNLQNVASGESSKETEVKAEARTVFGPPPDYVWRSYDWKNIEVFIPAFASGEPELVQILRAGGDVHQNTADSLRITRLVAKRVFFGLLYGIGGELLAKQLGISVSRCWQIINNFKEKYATMSEWMDELKTTALNDGYITTPFGRRQQIDPDKAYRAVNYDIQGTAADILKRSKIRIHTALKQTGLDAHIILPIHDEVLLQVRKGVSLQRVDDLVVRCMQENPELNMPVRIPVSISAITTNWHEKQKVRLAA